MFKRKLQNYLGGHGQHFYLIVKSALLNVTTNVLGSLISLASSLLIAKYFGSSVVGTIAILTAIVSIANLLANAGIGQAVVRLIPEYRSRYGADGAYTVYLHAFRLRLFFLFMTVAIYFALLDQIENFFFGTSDFPIRSALVFAGFTVLIGSLFTLNLQTLRGLKRISLYNLLEISPRIILLLFVLAVIATSQVEIHIIYAKLAGEILAGLLSLVLVVTVFRSLKPSRVEAMELKPATTMAIALPMLLTNALYLLMRQTDVLMLGSMLNESAVGIYQIAAKVTIVMGFLGNGVALMAAPTIAELYHAGDLDKLEQLIRKTKAFLFILSVPVYTLLLLFGERLLAYFGEEFASGYVVMAVMASSSLLSVWYALVLQFMNMTGHQLTMSRFVLVALVVNIAMNLLLIPRMGIEGAALASLISTLTWNLLASEFIRKTYGLSLQMTRKG